MIYKLSNIGIVILNYNGEKFLKKFLPDILKYSPNSKIYIIDNCSEDNSIKLIKNNFKKINIIQLKKNYGYSKGYNLGLKNIKEKILCLINNDVKVSKGWINPILAFFNKNKKAAILQPHIMSHLNKNKFEYAGAAGGFIDKLGYPFCKGRIFNYLEENKKQYDKNSQIFWASGSCFFIKNDLFRELNGFDDDFFAHQEEIDLCWRAKIRGNEIWSIYNSKVYHLGGGTISYNSPQKTFLNHRNNILMLIKNLPNDMFFNILFKRFILDFITSLWHFFNFRPKHSFSIIKAYWDLIFLFKRFRNKRYNSNNYNKYFIINNLPYSYFIKRLKKFTDLKVNNNNLC